MAWSILILAMLLPISYLLLEIYRAPLLDDEDCLVEEKEYDKF